MRMNIRKFGRPFETTTYRRYIKIMQCMKANMDDRTCKFKYHALKLCAIL